MQLIQLIQLNYIIGELGFRIVNAPFLRSSNSVFLIYNVVYLSNCLYYATVYYNYLKVTKSELYMPHKWLASPILTNWTKINYLKPNIILSLWNENDWYHRREKFIISRQIYTLPVLLRARVVKYFLMLCFFFLLCVSLVLLVYTDCALCTRTCSRFRFCLELVLFNLFICQLFFNFMLHWCCLSIRIVICVLADALASGAICRSRCSIFCYFFGLVLCFNGVVGSIVY